MQLIKSQLSRFVTIFANCSWTVIFFYLWSALCVESLKLEQNWWSLYEKYVFNNNYLRHFVVGLQGPSFGHGNPEGPIWISILFMKSWVRPLSYLLVSLDQLLFSICCESIWGLNNKKNNNVILNHRDN